MFTPLALALVLSSQAASTTAPDPAARGAAGVAANVADGAASTSATASAGAVNADGSQAAASNIVCRSVPVTGRRVPVRQCTDRVATEREAERSRDQVRRIQENYRPVSIGTRQPGGAGG